MRKRHSDVIGCFVWMIQPSDLIVLSDICLISVSFFLFWFQNYPICPSRPLWRCATKSEDSLWPASGPPLREQWGTEHRCQCSKLVTGSLADISFFLSNSVLQRKTCWYWQSITLMSVLYEHQHLPAGVIWEMLMGSMHLSLRSFCANKMKYLRISHSFPYFCCGFALALLETASLTKEMPNLAHQ